MSPLWAGLMRVSRLIGDLGRPLGLLRPGLWSLSCPYYFSFGEEFMNSLQKDPEYFKALVVCVFDVPG